MTAVGGCSEDRVAFAAWAEIPARQEISQYSDPERSRGDTYEILLDQIS